MRAWPTLEARVRAAAWWAVVASLVLGASTPASAQAPLIVGLGGPLDLGTLALARGDDESSAALDLTPTFPGGVDFYGGHYTSLYVNINGSVSFSAPVRTYSPESFPRVSGVSMIAAWWADVDTRVVPTSAPDANQIYYAATAEHFVVTWTDVGYFDQHTDRLDAFQIVLTPSAGRPAGAFDVQFRYHRCEWTAGDRSGGSGGLGGTGAQAGFDAADGTHFVMLPGSRTDAVLTLCDTSNLMPPEQGVWNLESVVPAPTCGNGLRETGEECDDGNRIAHDWCDNDCLDTMPCLELYPDGAVGSPFPYPDANFGEAGLPDANGADAFGGGFPDIGPIPDTDILHLDMGIGLLRPCTSTMGDDAGRRPDSGVRFDAGPATDGGMDGGPRRNELDVTGGGCGCRAGTRGGGALVGATLAILLVASRRRRSRSGD